MSSRRRFLVAAGALALPALGEAGWAATLADRHGSKRLADLPRACAALEAANGGRLGVAVIDTGSGERAGYRAEERFPMCSTFKCLLAAAVLARVDRGEMALSALVAVPRAPLLSNSPLTEPHAGGAMTVAELCFAALTRSDNTAANLLLERLVPGSAGGAAGPVAYTRFVRGLGDGVTRLDRNEPTLNESAVGDERDTTTPTAMARDLRRVLLGEVLRPGSRAQLRAWMEANVTGLERLRARLPEGWRAADKTGSNGTHTSNDIAVLWPPAGPPIVVAAYITQCFGPEAKRAAMLARVGEMVR